MNDKKYLIGLDLHGTLLDENWKIKENLKEELINRLKSLKNFCRIYVCSGNDLTFLRQYLPSEIFNLFDGFILETGCVISDGKTETIIADNSLVDTIKNLENELKKILKGEILYFAKRLTSISLFTKHEGRGIDPSLILEKIENLVDHLGFAGKVLVTHSDVAVDIIPTGYNKFTGMKFASENLKTIGIADSLNDYQMILDADYAFMPHNASPKLINLLQRSNKKIKNIAVTAKIDKNIILQSNYSHTEGVIEILDFINKNPPKADPPLAEKKFTKKLFS
ncbi:HAD family phosphatase [Candidatus Falkowbacteria bacterium]|nr:HAD family phosphatase [Candidatus Falkowbacteria bacterium]